ncbi:type II toxin-antitoxin system VapC family toxin [Blastococcus sp. BMG 814]|uniref:Ribonuclease VapC n=1 Tax=Blastococcus carthaginiensis TaxID=3050034 RepID=A0ABT9IHQ1_9ACTN|nr:type II toxin-antitoxin system VapC family toxin [Blastococcus carthaginiensis]MDP5185113.1 type II toxin-antitoxin system VapC family toxin [Blastococcus carthaginiensis]
MTRGLLDTSVFIAREGRRLDSAQLPEQVAVSVITYGELRAGVLAATDLSVRSRRLSTLQAVAELNPLPIDAAVADAWAELRLRIAQAGRRMNVNDTWIAATALAHDVPVVSQDADFDVLAGISPLRVVRV